MVERYKNPDVKIPIQISYFANEGKNFKVKASAYNSFVEKEYDIVDVASNKPVDENTISQKLSELGETIFRVEQIKGEVSQNAFYPMSKIKNIKREIVDLLKDQILIDYNNSKQRSIYTKTNISIKPYMAKNVLLEIDKDVDFDLDLNSVDLVIKIEDYTQSNIKNWLIYNKIDKYLLKLPKILRAKDLDVVKDFIKNDSKIAGIVAENIGAVQLAIDMDKACVFGMGMNILNSNIKDTFDVKEFVQSVELSCSENIKGAYIYSYGYIPLMSFTHCPVQLNTGCKCGTCKYSGDFEYINRDNHYKVRREKVSNCYFELLSPKVLDLRSLKNAKVYISLSRIDDDKAQIVSDFIKKEDNSTENPYLGHSYLPIK